jgi:hypothetical protein
VGHTDSMIDLEKRCTIDVQMMYIYHLSCSYFNNVLVWFVSTVEDSTHFSFIGSSTYSFWIRKREGFSLVIIFLI